MSKRSRYAHRRQANKRRYFEWLESMVRTGIDDAITLRKLTAAINGQPLIISSTAQDLFMELGGELPPK